MKAKKTKSKSTTKSNPKTNTKSNPKTNTKSNPKPNTKIRNRTKSKPKTPKQMEGKQIPNITLDTRVRNSKLKGNNPFKWEKVQTKELFKNKKIVLFSLPGAYTPTCSNSHLPDYDKKYNQLINRDIDDVYCLSVNDAFVMYNWGKQLNINNVKLLPDGNALFTKKMGALVKKNNLGFLETIQSNLIYNFESNIFIYKSNNNIDNYNITWYYSNIQYESDKNDNEL